MSQQAGWAVQVLERILFEDDMRCAHVDWQSAPQQTEGEIRAGRYRFTSLLQSMRLMQEHKTRDRMASEMGMT